MDSDDIALPKRIQTQVKLLEKHPKIAGCGTWMETFGEKSDIWKYPKDSNRLKCELLFRCELAHPTTMYRKDVLEKYQIRYNNKIKYVEDYDFWYQLIKYENLCNIAEPLLLYRLHTNNISRSNDLEKSKALMEVHRKLISEIGIRPTKRQLLLHESLARSSYDVNTNFLKQSRGLALNSSLKRIVAILFIKRRI